MAATSRELDEFLTAGLKRQIDADFALHDGDPGPRLALWTHPVSRPAQADGRRPQ